MYTALGSTGDAEPNKGQNLYSEPAVYVGFTTATCLSLESEDQGHGGGAGQSQQGLLWLEHGPEMQGWEGGWHTGIAR